MCKSHNHCLSDSAVRSVPQTSGGFNKVAEAVVSFPAPLMTSISSTLSEIFSETNFPPCRQQERRPAAFVRPSFERFVSLHKRFERRARPSFETKTRQLHRVVTSLRKTKKKSPRCLGLSVFNNQIKFEPSATARTPPAPPLSRSAYLNSPLFM